LLIVLVTESLLPFLTTATTDEGALGWVRTFSWVVAYLVSITLSDRVGVIVSEADVFGLSTEAILTGGRVMRRLGSRVRSLVPLGDDSTKTVEAGAG
jgi:hypothetical protein